MKLTIQFVVKTHKKTTYLAVDTNFRITAGVLLELGDVKFKMDPVDGEMHLSGIILQNSSQKRLGEIETGEPEHNRYSFVDPVLEEF